MPLTIRVLAPDQSVFDAKADEVIIPSTTGLLGILPGHISLVTAVDIGVMRIFSDGAWNSIALMGGFAEVEADDVTVLVNGAEMGQDIDTIEAESELEKAKAALSQLEDQTVSTEKIKAQEEFNRARARVQASKTEG